MKFKFIRILKRLNLLIGFNRFIETQDSDYFYNNFRTEAIDENYSSEFSLTGKGYSVLFWPYEMILKPSMLFGFISIYGSIFFTEKHSILKIRIRLSSFIHAIYIVVLQIAMSLLAFAKAAAHIPVDYFEFIFILFLLSIPSLPILIYLFAGLKIKNEYQKFLYKFNDKLQ